ncbi:MAG: Hsp70 family protein, partial [Roseibium sp.]
MTQVAGLDFGTSNTVAVASDGGVSTVPIKFGNDAEAVTSLPSVLSFLDRGSLKPPHPEVGPWAIRQFLESLGDVRFLQSLKTFAASNTFKGTGIFGTRFD